MTYQPHDVPGIVLPVRIGLALHLILVDHHSSAERDPSRYSNVSAGMLATMPDSRIDFSDAPDSKRPSKVLVGRFYRPAKQPISLRVDADVVAWFRGHGRNYQTYMNEVLRREMQAHPRSR